VKSVLSHGTLSLESHDRAIGKAQKQKERNIKKDTKITPCI